MRFQDAILNEAKDVDPYEIVKLVYDKAFPFVKEYLKHYRAEIYDDLFWSGRSGKKAYEVKKIRTDRRPKDTGYDAHYKLDDMFQQEFGIRYRSSSIFVSGKRTEASNYGDNVYAIFPTGNNYNYVFNRKVTDLYSDVVDGGGGNDYGMYFAMEPEELANQEARYNDDLESEARDIAGETFDNHHYLEDEESDENVFMDARSDYIEDHYDDILTDISMSEAETKVSEAEYEVERIVSEYESNNLKGAIQSGNEIMLAGKEVLAVRYDYVPFILRYMNEYKTVKPTKERYAYAMRNINDQIRKFPSVDQGESYARILKKYIN